MNKPLKSWRIPDYDWLVQIDRYQDDLRFSLEIIGSTRRFLRCITLTKETARELARDLLEAADMKDD
jgi:hypothetical protein